VPLGCQNTFHVLEKEFGEGEHSQAEFKGGKVMLVLSFGVSFVPFLIQHCYSLCFVLHWVFKVFIELLIKNDNVFERTFSNPIVL
jgi:cobalamin biosynthesis protein CobD/CbiB